MKSEVRSVLQSRYDYYNASYVTSDTVLALGQSDDNLLRRDIYHATILRDLASCMLDLETDTNNWDDQLINVLDAVNDGYQAWKQEENFLVMGAFEVTEENFTEAYKLKVLNTLCEAIDSIKPTNSSTLGPSNKKLFDGLINIMDTQLETSFQEAANDYNSGLMFELPESHYAKSANSAI